jgi:hypothetical protein
VAAVEFEVSYEARLAAGDEVAAVDVATARGEAAREGGEDLGGGVGEGESDEVGGLVLEEVFEGLVEGFHGRDGRRGREEGRGGDYGVRLT